MRSRAASEENSSKSNPFAMLNEAWSREYRAQEKITQPAPFISNKRDEWRGLHPDGIYVYLTSTKGCTHIGIYKHVDQDSQGDHNVEDTTGSIALCQRKNAVNQ